jgi:hypothetical protein
MNNKNVHSDINMTPRTSETSQVQLATVEYHEVVFGYNNLSKYEYIEFPSNNGNDRVKMHTTYKLIFKITAGNESARSSTTFSSSEHCGPLSTTYRPCA